MGRSHCLPKPTNITVTWTLKAPLNGHVKTLYEGGGGGGGRGAEGRGKGGWLPREAAVCFSNICASVIVRMGNDQSEQRFAEQRNQDAISAQFESIWKSLSCLGGKKERKKKRNPTSVFHPSEENCSCSWIHQTLFFFFLLRHPPRFITFREHFKGGCLSCKGRPLPRHACLKETIRRPFTSLTMEINLNLASDVSAHQTSRCDNANFPWQLRLSRDESVEARGFVISTVPSRDCWEVV